MNRKSENSQDTELLEALSVLIIPWESKMI